MKAMLLAAGLGTRLKPLTDHVPKALVEVGGITLLERSIHYLKKFGVADMILNVHHFSDQIARFLEAKDFGISITLSDESDRLLDTGGGLKKAAWFFDDGRPFLVYNTDVLTDLDLGALLRKQEQCAGLATLAVRHRDSGRCLLFNAEMELSGWRNRKSGQTRWCGEAISPVEELAFSGIQVLDPKLFHFFPEEEVFSLVDLYLRAGAVGKICGFLHDDSHWMDAGKIDDIREAEKMVRYL